MCSNTQFMAGSTPGEGGDYSGLSAWEVGLPWAIPWLLVLKTAFLQPSMSNPIDTSCITIPSSISMATGTGSSGPPSGSSFSPGCKPHPRKSVISSSSGISSTSTSEDRNSATSHKRSNTHTIFPGCPVICNIKSVEL